ncbi:Integral membrane protein [Pediococcus damnosus]|uniref:Integral membrane protein n=1 Tax=Pediococcus damnosus TaxID=51663 RepID=A0ABN4NBN2_9LACO|nr:acyltransferase [Pediococcus damnosus]AMV61466.1 Integral membrane protein [Pediococcus damnosus]AMV65828.1 Integral membrane protein [Pediococcus damnosus]AMV67977.1 Integral membrane protein [Pediococcus damnosus]AMV70167.1 Integral membrane protein [Pediococcus damnosus]KJU75219.1 membrane protein [Pediococcus damnosus LMG 28219]
MTVRTKTNVPAADVGDYMKVFACTAVMMQTVLSLVLKTGPNSNVQTGIGVIYNLVKYTAPAFIFGILFTTIRTNESSDLSNYGNYMSKTFSSLFVPTFWWTLVYLIFIPSVQQITHFHNVTSFLWQFVNGNAAPHLWYNTMMLQFIILMPFFWWLSRWAVKSNKKLFCVLTVTVIGYFCWLLFYDHFVFYGPQMQHWYLLDRIFISFIIYGILGALAWKKHVQLENWLRKFWWLAAIVFVLSFVWTNSELKSFGHPVNLANAIYYKPSMTIYALAVIGLIAALAFMNIRHHSDVLNPMHFLATYAYRAYLSNVFWLQIIWHLFGHNLSNVHPVWSIVSCYILTWILAFASAYLLHIGWFSIKNKIHS